MGLGYSGQAAKVPSKSAAPAAHTTFVLEKMEETDAKLEAILNQMNTVMDEIQNFQKQMEDYYSSIFSEQFKWLYVKNGLHMRKLCLF
jgi:hypothetical protein